jgi:hypothetical protein
MALEIARDHQIDLAGLPVFWCNYIIKTLASPQCTSDDALLLADALAEVRDYNGSDWRFHDAITRAERDVRDAAPIFAGAIA